MSAFARGKRGNRSIYVPTRSGALVQRSTGTHTPSVVRGMERMVREFKDAHRWVLLAAMVNRDKSKPRLSLRDAYAAYSSNAVDELQARISSVNLADHLDAWIGWVRANRQKDVRTADVYWQQVTTLVAVGSTFPASDLTKACVITWLASRAKASSGTRRKYLYALKSFIRYLNDVGALSSDPLAGLKAPKKNAARKRWVTVEIDERIVSASSPQYRALFAFIKSTGCDVGSALRSQKGDVNLFGKTADIRGTKTDRRHVHAASIEPWAIPPLVEHLRAFENKPTHALLFPGLKRSAATQHHKRICDKLGVAGYTLKDSRHSVGVRMRKAGKTFEEIAGQLGTSVYQAVNVYAAYGETITEQREAK